MSIYLESQLQNITTNVVMQNAMRQNNSKLGESSDYSDTLISVFNSKVRSEIHHKASLCNDTTGRAYLTQGKDQSKISQTCGEINSRVLDLQSFLSWTSDASQEIANIPGLSDSALNTLKQSWSETSSIASLLINNSVDYANEVLEKISKAQTNSEMDFAGKSSSSTSENPVESAVEATRETLDETIKTVSDRKSFDITPEKDVLQASSKDVESKNQTKTSEEKPVTQTKPKEAVANTSKITETAVTAKETKADIKNIPAVTNTPTVDTNALAANVTAEPVKLDIKS